MTKKAIAHKTAWWQIWVMVMITIIMVAFYQLCVVCQQGALERAAWDKEQQKIVEAKQAEDAEQAEDAMRAFLGKKKLLGLLPMGWWYKGRAHNLAMAERHWANKTIWQYIYWQDTLAIGIILELFGLAHHRTCKKKLASEMNKSTSVGKVFHPDLLFSPRGMRLSMLTSAGGFIAILFVRKYTAEIMFIVWMLLLLGESIRYKLKGGKLDFSIVPEGAANTGRIASRLWKKFRKNHLPKRRKRRSKSKRRIRSLKDLKFWFT